MSKERLPIKISLMLPGHLDQVSEIERQSYDEPWNSETVTRLMQREDTLGKVALHKQVVVGFLIYHLRPWVISAGKIALTNIAVHPNFRHRGVGTALLDNLKNQLSAKKQVIEVITDSPKILSCPFWQKTGFQTADGDATEIYKYHNEPRLPRGLLYLWKSAKDTASQDEPKAAAVTST